MTTTIKYPQISNYVILNFHYTQITPEPDWGCLRKIVPDRVSDKQVSAPRSLWIFCVSLNGWFTDTNLFFTYYTLILKVSTQKLHLSGKLKNGSTDRLKIFFYYLLECALNPIGRYIFVLYSINISSITFYHNYYCLMEI